MRHEPHNKPGVNLGAQEVYGPLVTLVVSLDTNPVISHEWGKDGIVIKTHNIFVVICDTDFV